VSVGSGIVNYPNHNKETTMAIDLAKLEQIEQWVALDMLTDQQIIEELQGAGLPQLAHAIENALR